MGITRFTTKVTLSRGVAVPSTGITVVGQPVWVVDYTVIERGRESSFQITDYSEAGARKLIANLLGNLAPGHAIEDVYTEQVDRPQPGESTRDDLQV